MNRNEFKVYGIDTAPPESRADLEKLTTNHGGIPNVHGVMAAAPPLLKSYLFLKEQFAKATLDKQERKIVLLAVSRELDSAYDTAAHSVLADKHNVPADVIEAVRTGRSLADDKLEALRQFTVDATRHHGRIAESTLGSFLAAGYTNANALEIVLAIGAVTLTSLTNRLAKTPLDTEFQAQEWKKAS
ncbi:MAG TPA: carboxymuconolactone decarboxylase family protein [Gammaproteobacteria bacterium]|jgi:alkylhydroperoxidase family enzyme|nr:carboxymuconolactone decarboxylase family protein [Gammaproteobacteria bacterium]